MIFKTQSFLPDGELTGLDNPGCVGKAGVGEEAEHRKETESVAVLSDRHAVGEEDAHPVLYLSRGQAEAAGGGQLKEIMGEIMVIGLNILKRS